MKVSEIASEQIYFHSSRVAKDGRSLADLDTPEYLIERAGMELQELSEAISSQKPPDEVLKELADCIIFLAGFGADICLKNGLPLSALDETILDKSQINRLKYSIENFGKSDTPEEGIELSRATWPTFAPLTDL